MRGVLLFLILLSWSFTTNGQEDLQLDCPLVWTESALGQKELEFSIPTALGGSTHFIARFVLSDRRYHVGRLQDGKAYVAYKEQVFVSEFYDVLTNPHGCIIKWSDERSSAHLVPVDGGYVGRALVSGVFLSGQVNGTSITVAAGVDEANILSSFDKLTSYSKGLEVEITKFDFGNHDFFTTNDVLGIDEIHNSADTEITQSVTHTKSILERTTISHKSSSRHVFKVGLTIGLELKLRTDGNTNMTFAGPELSMSYEMDTTSGKNQEHTKEIKNEYRITRKITVHPYSSLQICSTLTMLDSIELDYKAQGRYTGAGLTAEQVAEILKKDDKEGFTDGNSIIVEEVGSLVATMGLMSRFITTPYGDLNGCSQLVTKINKLKKLKERKSITREGIKSAAKDVDDFIVNIALRSSNLKKDLKTK